MNTDLDAWYREHGHAAEMEGWSIFDAEFVIARVDDLDHIEHELQLQRIDTQDHEGGVQLEDDCDAWEIVMAGAGAHHAQARLILAEQAPVEFSRMLARHHHWPI